MPNGFSGKFGTPATLEGGFGRMTSSIPTPDHTVVSVTASMSTITGEPGQVVTFTLAARNAAGAIVNGVTYSAVSANPSAVRVDSVSGRVVTCSILQLTAGVNVTGTCNAIDAAPVAISSSWILYQLLLSPSPITVEVGDSTNLTVVARNRFGLSMPVPTLSGSTTASSVATTGTIVSDTVPVNGIGPGSASIRVRTAAVLSNGVSVSVTAAGEPSVATSILVTPATLTPLSGASDLITAQVLDQFDAPMAVPGLVITWSDVLGSGGAFATPTSVTNGGGTATVGFTVAVDDAINHQIHAAADGPLTGTSSVIDVQAIGGGGGPTPSEMIQAILDGWFDYGSAEFYDASNNLLMQLTFGAPAATEDDVVSETETALPFLGGFVYVAGTPTRARIRGIGSDHYYDVAVATGGAADNKIVATTGVTWLVGQYVSVSSLFVTSDTNVYVFRGSISLTTPSIAAGEINMPELPREVPNFDAIDWSGAPVYTAAVDETMESAVANARLLLSGPVPMAVCKLRSGATYNTNFVGANFGQVGWVKITTNGTLPAPGVRMTPQLAVTHALPKIVAAANFDFTIKFAAGTRGYWIQGLEITCNPVESPYPLIGTGLFQPATIQDVPARLSFRQNYIHGHAAHFSRVRGIEMNGSVIEVVDNWMAHFNFGGVSYSPQSQSAASNNSIGKHRIENNGMWGCVETIGGGGAGQDVPYEAEQLCVADILVRRNHLFRPLSLKDVEGCANFLEFKNGRRILIECNIGENCWLDLQNGYTTSTWSANQNAGSNERWVQTCDVTIRFNWWKNCNAGYSIASIYPSTGPYVPPAPRRIHIHDNLHTGHAHPVTYNTAGMSFGRALVIAHDTEEVLIEHNTILNASVALSLDNGAIRKHTKLIVRNNILQGYYFADGGDGIHNGQGAWDFATDASCRFTGNVCLEGSGLGIINPGSNTLVAAVADVGFATPGVLTSSTTKYADLAGAIVTGGNAGKGCDVAGLITRLVDVEAPELAMAA